MLCMPLLNDGQFFLNMKASVLVRIVAQSADVAHFVHTGVFMNGLKRLFAYGARACMADRT